MPRFSWGGLASLVRLSDEQAMEGVRKGDDPGAFALLVRRWEGPIRRLCARMVGDAHRAEDLAQEAFARLFVRRKHYQPVARFASFPGSAWEPEMRSEWRADYHGRSRLCGSYGTRSVPTIFTG